MGSVTKILLGISLLFYTLIVYSVLTESFLFTLILVVIHSISLLSFVLVYIWHLQKENGPRNAEFFRKQEEERIKHQELIDDLNETIATKEKTLADKEKELITAGETITRLTTSVDELEKQAEESVSDFQNRLHKLNEKSLLPISSSEIPIPLDIKESIRNAVAEMQSGFDRAKIHIQLAFPPYTVLVKADKQHLRILFRNILDNTIKYMKHAGVLVITLSQIDDKCLVVLKDNGEGLSPEETAHVFELNYQGSNKTSGNGLGLSQAKVIAEHYEGKISARSSIGNGMGIFVELPAVKGGQNR